MVKLVIVKGVEKMKKITRLLIGVILCGFICMNSINISFADSDLSISRESLISDKSISNSVENNFSNIKLGMTSSEVVGLVGEPCRVDSSEYGFKWFVYNSNYRQFFMIGIDKEKVVGLYTNSLYNNMLGDISFNKDIKYVRDNYNVLNNLKAILSFINISKNDEYDVIDKGDYYITVFYDLFNQNKVTSYEVIDSKYKKNALIQYALKVLNAKSTLYNKDLEKSYELQMYDLVNSVRAKNNLNTLYYDDKYASKSSKLHSLDMRNNKYFGHINTLNEDVSVRLSRTGVNYLIVGENLAGGQYSSIYAHEALMNSKGHRENVLKDCYDTIGIGVAFGGDYNTYYTQNYYLNSLIE